MSATARCSTGASTTHTTDQAIAALTEAVDSEQRVVVTSGGHCLEGFVSDPEVRVLIDISPMRGVYYDAERKAIAVEAGATVGETFRALFDSWRPVLPLGEHPKLGAGGHMVGGAFGLAADHLYAVEVTPTTGALINHPDVDLADPAWNTSGVAWSTLYYHEHYARCR